MRISAKSRPVGAFVTDPHAGKSVNDNVPGIHPGHELSDLEGVPRQPAGEAVVLYARFAHIGSFPVHAHHGEPVAKADAPAMNAEPEKPMPGAKPAGKRVTFACLGSAFFHIGLVAILAMGLVATHEESQEEAGDAISVVILGDSDADQASAGEQKEEPPQEIVAEAVQPKTLQPTEAQPVQQAETQPTEIQPQQTQAVAPEPVQEAAPVEAAQPVQTASPQTVATPEPEVLTTTAPAETSVVQPMAATVPEEIKPTETAAVAEALPEPVPPEEVATPAPKPEAMQPVEKPKETTKKEPPKKAAKTKAGSGGENKQDSKRGSSDGEEVAQSDRNSRSAGNNSGAGSAAVANYPGKVQSRIRRSVRVPSEYKRMSASTTVRVRLTIESGGSLSGLSVARSSGIPALDQAVIEGVRRASPFPPLPAEWGRPSWSFTQEVQVTGR
ncbi:energy transducer TonB [Rhizobium sp. BK251]|uniref:energy transducer TonB family protein n=1 Tax=Rhizobium sp. BK251 TaxID=2512125 RepID=UPI001042D6B6|nr:energy transducer TonB [Rhizobium sp. BK251]TCL74530.1 protein TonB [Rhizobium sp. BK251]